MIWFAVPFLIIGFLVAMNFYFVYKKVLEKENRFKRELYAHLFKIDQVLNKQAKARLRVIKGGKDDEK